MDPVDTQTPRLGVTANATVRVSAASASRSGGPGRQKKNTALVRWLFTQRYRLAVLLCALVAGGALLFWWVRRRADGASVVATVNAGCPTGTVASTGGAGAAAGTCVACNTSSDCDGGSSACVAHACFHACMHDAQCPPAAPVCGVGGACVPCVTSAQCSGARFCVDSVCVACVTNGDCDETSVCDSTTHACVANCGGGACTGDAECAAGSTCSSDNVCRTAAGARAAGVCPPATYCQLDAADASAGRCVQCLDSSHCGGTHAVCDATTFTCVQCDTTHTCAEQGFTNHTCDIGTHACRLNECAQPALGTAVFTPKMQLHSGLDEPQQCLGLAAATVEPAGTLTQRSLEWRPCALPGTTGVAVDEQRWTMKAVSLADEGRTPVTVDNDVAPTPAWHLLPGTANGGGAAIGYTATATGGAVYMVPAGTAGFHIACRSGPSSPSLYLAAPAATAATTWTATVADAASFIATFPWGKVGDCATPVVPT